jgi:hypothetical protein
VVLVSPLIKLFTIYLYKPIGTYGRSLGGGGACLSGRDVGEVWFGNLGRQMTQFGPPMSTQTWHLLKQSKKHAHTTTYHVDLISTSRIMTRVQSAPETPRNSLSPSSFRETREFIFHVSF